MFGGYLMLLGLGHALRDDLKDWGWIRLKCQQIAADIG
jgi:hypothetical protein